jgi:regulator of sigma E protease
MTFLIFIAILSILVLIHEFGHFIVAKKNGIKIEEFGVGIPPRIFGKKIGGTIYSLNWLPFGGFVRMLGEDSEDEKALKNHHSFMAKKPNQRALVLLAGVSMNLLLAVLLYYIFFTFNKFQTFYIPLIFQHKFPFGKVETIGTTVSGFLEGSSAKKSGVELGDAILKIDDTPVYSVLDVRNAVKGKVNTEVTLLLSDLKTPDNKTTHIVKTVPIVDESGNTIIGVYLTDSVRIKYDKLAEKIFVGPVHAYNMLGYSTSSLYKLFKMSIESKDISPVSQTVSGPVGIYNVVGGILEYGGSKVVLNLLDFMALVSLSLAFLNILPFPALDGGRLVFVIIEMIRGGKKLRPSLESKVHGFGMAVLLGILLIVTVKDIVM